MRRLWMILILIFLLVGCHEAPPLLLAKPPAGTKQDAGVKTMLRPADEKWVSRYGDTTETALAYNIRVLIHMQGQQSKQIQNLNDRLIILERKNDDDTEGKTEGDTEGKTEGDTEGKTEGDTEGKTD